MIGPGKYREGMDLYFERHDGQAVTIEDFYACFESVTGQDFSQFRRWYAQAGTPEVAVTEHWDEATSTLRVDLAQSLAPTPGQPVKQPVPIPLLCALLDGSDPFLYVLDQPAGTLELKAKPGAGRPLLSVNRDFTAPVRIARKLSGEVRLALVRAETDPFNKWDGLQTLIKDELLALSDGSQAKPGQDLVEAIAAAVRGAIDDPAFAALLTRLPEVGELFLERQPADPVALSSARKRLQAALYEQLSSTIAETLLAPAPSPYHPGAEQASIRALRTAFIGLLGGSGMAESASALLGVYERAPNMTERLAALRALAITPGKARQEALSHFESLWKANPLVMDKWFLAQASAGTAEDIQRLVAHPAFDLRNPNRVRSVIAAFTSQNLAAFHAPDGSGYRAIEATLLAADKANPALGARLLTGFESGRILEPKARAEAEACLKRLVDAGLSDNAMDIASRALSTGD